VEPGSLIDNTMPPPLACTVRGCHLPLRREGRTWLCDAGHTYDIARSGYVNLLQPQDRRSRRPGDTKTAVEARHRLLAAGVGHSIADALVGRAHARLAGGGLVAVDLGSGAGDVLAAAASAAPNTAIGIDLSAAAAEIAARRFPDRTWVVANADRRLPLLDRSVDLILSLHGRRNSPECARVLRPAGALLVAVPGPDDLIELRAAVQGREVERARGDAIVDAHEPHFSVIERATIRERRRLGRDALVDLLRGTYRGARVSAETRVEALADLEVTLSSEVFVLAPR
jgi:23S rRNA (guanine745-N1)-methyltransferase